MFNKLLKLTFHIQKRCFYDYTKQENTIKNSIKAELDYINWLDSMSKMHSNNSSNFLKPKTYSEDKIPKNWDYESKMSYLHSINKYSG